MRRIRPVHVWVLDVQPHLAAVDTRSESVRRVLGEAEAEFLVKTLRVLRCTYGEWDSGVFFAGECYPKSGQFLPESLAEKIFAYHPPAQRHCRRFEVVQGDPAGPDHFAFELDNVIISGTFRV